MNALREINFKDKQVLLRVDYNVPIDDSISRPHAISTPTIRDTHRIDTTLPTIRHIINEGASVIYLISHRGRPGGKYVPELDLSPVHNYLKTLDGLKHVEFIQGKWSWNHERTKTKTDDQTISTPNPTGTRIILFDNIRFHPEEEAETITDEVRNFRRYLTSLCDVYVNDAFACCHREHSSIVGIDAPVKCYGDIIGKELYYLQSIFEAEYPEKRRKGNWSGRSKIITAIVGGSKVSDKIKLLERMIPKINHLLIGGGMAFTFMKYMGYTIGDSLFDKEGYELVPRIIENARRHGVVLSLPLDFICNTTFSNSGDIIETGMNIPNGYMGLDIGPRTIEAFQRTIDMTNCVIWNGPLGVFEMESFSHGTRRLMEYIGEWSWTWKVLNVSRNRNRRGQGQGQGQGRDDGTPHNDKMSIIGGGDTAACCLQFGCREKMSWISTGGGASLTLIEGGTLPGLTFLEKESE